MAKPNIQKAGIAIRKVVTMQFDIITEDTADGINVKVVPARIGEYGYPPGYKHCLTIQAGNKGQAVNKARFAISEALKASRFEQ